MWNRSNCLEVTREMLFKYLNKAAPKRCRYLKKYQRKRYVNYKPISSRKIEGKIYASAHR